MSPELRDKHLVNQKKNIDSFQNDLFSIGIIILKSIK